MERQFSVGLAVGLVISGVACLMVTVSQQVGIGLILVAIVWWFLFIFPKSPVRRYWWSVSSKLGITLADGSEVQVGTTEGSIVFRVGLRAMPSIQVNKIGLRIGQRTLGSNWEPTEIKADEAPHM